MYVVSHHRAVCGCYIIGGALKEGYGYMNPCLVLNVLIEKFKKLIMAGVIVYVSLMNALGMQVFFY